MLIVGSDRLSPSGPSGAPEGTRHAVDRQGRVLCRTSRARFTWPHLSWENVSGDEAACRLCAQVRAAQEALAAFDPYPTEHAHPGDQAILRATPVGSANEPAHVIGSEIVAWQPSPGLFVPNEQ